MIEKAILPEFLQPDSIDTLTRLGREFDGGYLVDERSVLSADLLIGLGICDDWSFEQEFKARNDVKVFAFDASVSKKKFRKKMLRSIFRFTRPEIFRQRRSVYNNYVNFFGEDNDTFHIEKFIGTHKNSNQLSFPQLRDRFIPGSSKNIFLKVDIEGWEYRCLDDIVDMAPVICGLAIEFHDVDLHMDKIKKFVNGFPLNLCHIHINNSGGVDINNTPLVIEATFTKFDVDQSRKNTLPHIKDMPNDPLLNDFEIIFQ